MRQIDEGIKLDHVQIGRNTMPEITLTNNLGSKYTVALIDRETANDILANLNFAEMAEKVVENGVSGWLLDIDLDLTNEEIIYSVTSPGASAVAVHYIRIATLKFDGSACFDVDDILGDMQYEELGVDEETDWHERQKAFENHADYKEMAVNVAAEWIEQEYLRLEANDYSGLKLQLIYG